MVGARVLAKNPAHRQQLIAGALQLAGNAGISSLHFLFPETGDINDLSQSGFMLRQGIQFHWCNDGYADFEQFLSRLSHDKRKKIRQERRKVHAAGITFDWLEGKRISEDDWRFFHRCYRQTYREHHSSPYLNLAFFLRVGAKMPDSFVLVRALREGRPVAASLLVRNTARLYGRHWGAIEHHPMLHFETCYYQAIEYAIARGLKVFEGGAQGEHKMARGLLPVTTQSAHWLAHPEFAVAVEKFLDRETALVDAHARTLADRNPFKSG